MYVFCRGKLCSVLLIHEGEFLMEKYISLAHGDGGELSHRLIRYLFVEAFGDGKATMFDTAEITLSSQQIAVSTDPFVIKPIYFTGGSIGKLANAGTVNDSAVSGANPAFLTCVFVIEEGFLISDLKKFVTNMANVTRKTGVAIVAEATRGVDR
jgi:hydrogenase expression/formation protein HypE